MAIDTFRLLIREFADALNAAWISADEQGYAEFSFEGLHVCLQYEGEADEIVLFGRVGEIEEDRREDIFEMLLGANLFWPLTKGATFSILPSINRVILADKRLLSTLVSGAEGGGPVLLNAWIEAFLDIAHYWRGRLQTANGGGSTIGDWVDVPAVPRFDNAIRG